MKLVPIILSGGIGSRLWPLSRVSRPKPFIQLTDGESLLQKTLTRAYGLPYVTETITVTNRDLFFSTHEEYENLALPNPQRHTFILEPFGRNSAAAIALAAHCCYAQQDKDTFLLILPADHLITDQAAFYDAVCTAMELANQGQIVTFGIQPDAPKTGYGYIQAGENHHVLQFVEKPNLETAKRYIRDKSFFWNAGIFCIHIRTLMEELQIHCPGLFKDTRRCFDHAITGQHGMHRQYTISPEEFSSVEDISIDYALLEKSNKVSVIPCDIGWSDIGSWIEFGLIKPADAHQNHTSGETLLVDTHNCIIHAKERTIATLGLNELIIVDTEDALLIAEKSRAQDIKQISHILKKNNHKAYKEFPSKQYPWGYCKTLKKKTKFQILLFHIKAYQEVTLKVEEDEHWVMVEGEIEISCERKTNLLAAKESIHTGENKKYDLKNTTSRVATMLAIQFNPHS